MASSPQSLPELDRSLREKRGRVVSSIEDIRSRVRADLYELNPRQQAKHHPEAVLAAVAVIALLGGRIVGGLASMVWR